MSTVVHRSIFRNAGVVNRAELLIGGRSVGKYLDKQLAVAHNAKHVMRSVD
jgi:hypothetical protein